MGAAQCAQKTLGGTASRSLLSERRVLGVEVGPTFGRSVDAVESRGPIRSVCALLLPIV
jgi:hypothetical protein